MQFDWNQYLTLANKLALSSGDEASLRSAISRAYYCAFNLALAKAKINGYRPKSDETGGTHELLWQLYGRNNTDGICKQLALLGPRMKFRRVRADYHDEIRRLRDEVTDALLDAQKCVTLLAELPQDLPADVPRTYFF
jgi:uncharacterized protein (UPF0332 family)